MNPNIDGSQMQHILFRASSTTIGASIYYTLQFHTLPSSALRDRAPIERA